MTIVGRVAAIRRYPVKSLLGEQLDRALLGPDGIGGDRGFAVRDVASGRVLGAKRHPDLLRARATGGEAVTVALPGGASYPAGDPALDAALGELLGRPVQVVEAPRDGSRTTIETDVATYLSRPGDFHDAAPLLLLSTSTLAFLGERYPAGRFDMRRFRANLLIDTDGSGEAEQDWVGHTLAIGDARLGVARACLRCTVTNAAQEDLPHDPGILRTVAREAGNRAGAYADVLTPGEVAVGDEVLLAD